MSLKKTVVDFLSRTRSIRALALCMAVAMARTSAAADLIVPDQYAGIQAAINAATHGDTVLVRAGTYVGRIDLRGKRITLKGELGPSATFIDPQGQGGVVVNCDEGETDQTVIDGFTIRNGLDSGIYISGASPVIRNCWFVNNQAGRGGGAHVRAGSNVTWENCKFTGNKANSGDCFGGALYVESSTASCASTQFASNRAERPNGGYSGGARYQRGGAIYASSSTINLTGCSSSDNAAWMNFENGVYCQNAWREFYSQGGFLFLSGGSATIRNHVSNSDLAYLRCVATVDLCGDHTYSADSRAGFTYTSDGASLVIEDSTITGNRAEVIGQGGCCHYNDVYPRCFGGVFFVAGSQLTIRRTAISNGSTVRTWIGGTGGPMESNGGTIYHESGALTIADSQIVNSNGLDHGGAMHSVSGAGLTITNTAFRNCVAAGRGGAIFHTTGATWNLSGVTFENCTAQNGNGGAIWLTGGTRTFTNCTFTNNLAQGSGDLRGGGIYAEGGAAITMASGTFNGNRVTSSGDNAERWSRGGATAFIGCTPVYDRCTFEGNSVTVSGNGGSIRRAHGGATWEHDSDARYTDCTFKLNKAENSGTADRESYGGAVYLWSSDSKFLRCTFDDCRTLPTNTRALGGGVFMDGVSRPTFSYCSVIGCDAASGAGVYSANSEPYFTSVAFRSNEASASGGGLFVDASSTPYVLGCTFERNTAPSGGAVKTLGSGTNLPFIVNTSFCGSGAEPISGGILGGSGNGSSTACSTDCNGNGLSDADEIASGAASDVDGNGVPDGCQPDCNANGKPDAYELARNEVSDCNGNGRPDSCDVALGMSADANANGVPDECELTAARLVPFEYSSIQSAINAAVNGDTIFVAPGAYYEKFSLGSKQVSLKSISGRELTFIDGNGVNGTLLTIEGGQSASTVIDGFTFWYAQGGWAVRIYNASPTIRNCRLIYNSHNTDGAGFRVESPSSAAITDCVVESNTANMGGGLWTNASPVLTRVVFTGNLANDDGGAVRVVNGSNGARFVDCTFSSNRAQGGGDHRGGAVYATNATNLSFSACSFAGNLATSNGDGSDRRAYGGAVAFDDCVRSGSNPPDTFTDCTFSQNTSRTTGNGGGTRYTFGGAAFDWNSDLRYLRCTFTGNKAETTSNGGRTSRGGAIWSGATDARIDACSFVDNACATNDSGESMGGAIFVESASNGVVVGSQFRGNAARQGAGMFLTGNSQPNIRTSDFISNVATDSGGAAHASTSPAFFFDCEFRLNRAATNRGSVLFAEGTSGPTIYGSLLCGNPGNDLVGTFTSDQNSSSEYCADCDGNGLEDADDIAAGRSADCDSNGVPDSCQTDRDRDGAIDACDGCPDNPSKTSAGACGCTVADTDTDLDGTADCIDSDDDGDGVPDAQDAFPLDSAESRDTDGDGVGDNGDPDADGDGVANAQDRCPLTSDPAQADFDADGQGDACDADDDGDGVADDVDGCPLNFAKTAPGACGCDRSDADSDQDGIADCIDNCPALPNLDQADCDDDGVGDACTAMVDCNDNDIHDACDIASGAADIDGNGVPDTCQPDCNGNGKPDIWEIAQGMAADCNLNGVPDSCDLLSSPTSDVDGDGTLDECEPDCNGDGLLDADQIAAGEPDCDGNGLLDECQDRSIRASSGQVGPFHATAPLTLPITGLTPATADVTIRIAASADLSAANEFVWLQVNGVDVTTPSTKYFVSGGRDCPASPDRVTAVISKARWNQLVTGSSAVITLRASPTVDAGQCPNSWALMSVRVLTSTGDCDQDGQSDLCEIASGTALDCDLDRKPDACAVASGLAPDCNGNGIPDSCDLASTPELDCDRDGLIDSCAIASGAVADCDANGRPDACDLASGAADCNGNAVPDRCEIASGELTDCDSDGTPDVCELVSGSALDCNENGTPDDCDIAAHRSLDVDANGVPDECAEDCNTNGKPDAWEIQTGLAPDCNGNGVPDACDLASGSDADCNSNGVPDTCDIATRTSADVDGNGIPDDCASDCNGNGVPDGFEIATGAAPDCNLNGTPDACDIASGAAEDCDLNSTPDTCDVLAGASDENGNQRIDDCEIAGGDFDLSGAIDTADLGFLLLFFGETDAPFGDLDQNGFVDTGDIAILLLLFG